MSNKDVNIESVAQNARPSPDLPALLTTPKSSKSPPLKIALIDDEPAILTLMKTFLSRKGYEVKTYQSASMSPFCQTQTCPCLNHPNCPDVVMVDVDMPGMNGVELLKHLHQRRCNCRHYAIMTGHGVDERDMIKLAKFGTRIFIKPFEFHELTAWLKSIKPA